jgi:triacylglycerol lipase
MQYLSVILLSFILITGCDQKATGKKVPAKPAFTEITASILAQITYCTNPQEKLNKFLPQWKIVWNPKPVEGNYAFVATDGTTYSIAIRGSVIDFSWDAFSNWIYHDFNIASQKKWMYADGTTDAYISLGAYEAFENMEKMKDTATGKSLWEFISTAVKEENKIVVTGHSLGGKLAGVYASYLHNKFKAAGKTNQSINVISFAAPAAGNQSFADAFNKTFPNAVRIENKNDLVPKFPVSGSMSELKNLFSSGPDAAVIDVGYKGFTIKLNTAIGFLATAMNIIDISNGGAYAQIAGDGKLISIPLSGKNNSNSIESWLAEAKYQHGMAQYAKFLGGPVFDCEEK